MITAKQLNAEIDASLIKRKNCYARDVAIKLATGHRHLRYSVAPHPNPAINHLVWQVSALENSNGTRNYDVPLNKTFDCRNQFVRSLRRRIHLAELYKYLSCRILSP